ncbi:hypothetical protein AUQ45_1670 [Streptococcus pyogenes]|nr:hypothetical protein AUQ45_1670 [Streptococcus pyogenes]
MSVTLENQGFFVTNHLSFTESTAKRTVALLKSAWGYF